jgi:hypothetical protein
MNLRGERWVSLAVSMPSACLDRRPRLSDTRASIAKSLRAAHVAKAEASVHWRPIRHPASFVVIGYPRRNFDSALGDPLHQNE